MMVGWALVVLPALYAAVMVWLRGGWEASASGRANSQRVRPATAVERPGPTALAHPASPAGANGGVAGRTPAGNSPDHSGLPIFSLLIAARNEAENLPHLLTALVAQTFPAAHFEVLLADDASTDGTAALVAAAAASSAFALRLITLPPGHTGKKAALAAALAQARAPWLVCTDADCRPGPGWLAAYAQLIRQHPATNFISGPVLLTGPPTFFQALMGLEFAGLIGVGGACLGRQRPTMCNGANLAYRRTAFEAVGGYFDNQHLASGDDEFLLHKIHRAFPGSARFLAQPAAIVRTAAPTTLGALLRQRVRWASKWRHYQSSTPQALALVVLGANVALAAGVGAGLRWPALWPWVAAAWLLKLGADAWLLRPVLTFLERRQWLWLLLPLQLLYAPYALAVGAAGWRGGYQWKGRAVR